MQNNEFIYKYSCLFFLFGTFTIEYFKRTTFYKSDLDWDLLYIEEFLPARCVTLMSYSTSLTEVGLQMSPSSTVKEKFTPKPLCPFVFLSLTYWIFHNSTLYGCWALRSNRCPFYQNCTLRAGSPAHTTQGGTKGCLNAARDRVPGTLCSSSASARPGMDTGVPSPPFAPWGKPALCLQTELPGWLRPALLLAVHDKLLAGTGDASQQLFPISSRVRQ